MTSKKSSVFNRFVKSVDDASFFGAAEDALSEISDPAEIVECAMLATKHEPGGGFYRARFLLKAVELLGKDEGQKKFKDLCKQAGLQQEKAKKYVEQGRVITSLASKSVDIFQLRTAPVQVFEFAQRQNGRMGNYLSEAIRILHQIPNATPTQIHNKWCQKFGGIKANLDIIKPSDWWAFSHPKWRKDDDFSGSIPGEVYANALYYFAPKTGVAVDPMAGSGMLKRVYEDRVLWQKDSEFELKIYLFDLRPSRNFIKKHDARKPLPIKADWIFIDPPYFGQSSHLYDGELATTKDYKSYLDELELILKAMYQSLNPKGRFCVFLPRWSGLRQQDPNYNTPNDVNKIALKIGFRWLDVAYVSRARQQEPGSALKNNSAKRVRRMRSDVCELNVYEKVR